MLNIIVVNNPKDWQLTLTDTEVVSAKNYLTDSRFAEMRNARVFNLCRSYRYQGLGYYVSLLAEARGQRVIPSTTTIQDLKLQSIPRIISQELEDLIQKSLSKLKSDKFTLSVYFGKNVAQQYEILSKQLYNILQAPLFKVQFVFNKKWSIQTINTIPLNEIPEHHRPYFLEFAKSYFAKKRFHNTKMQKTLYDLAILVNPEEKTPPSNKRAMKRFIDAAEDVGFRTKIITKDDIARIPEFDALFIRETTQVNHHTYRTARRAAAEGLVVIDDPKSILRCANKVYLAELLTKAKINTPKTLIVHKDNRDLVEQELGLPCVLKLPEAAFSQGVVKVSSSEALQKALDDYLAHSDLIIAQQYTPTDFDWRIGIMDKKPLFACKYHMAKNHWQIYNWQGKKTDTTGMADTLAIDKVPEAVITTALKAANLIGDSLYGVDLKQIGDKVMIIEVNDNPSVDTGVEDEVLGDALYATIMKSILNRIEAKKK
ncbi:MAG: glutathione synthase [Gammaproteobacteria bacterium]|nr:glutathione synthase [Gammaproteobacteria bacterium]